MPAKSAVRPPRPEPHVVLIAIKAEQPAWRNAAADFLGTQPLLPSSRLVLGRAPNHPEPSTTVTIVEGRCALNETSSDRHRRLVLVTGAHTIDARHLPVRRRDPWAVVHRSDPMSALAHAVMAVSRGGGWLSAGILSRFSLGTLDLSNGARSVEELPTWAGELTSREREILALLLHGRGHEAIARQLHIARSTLKTHIRSILRKSQYPNTHLLLTDLYGASARGSPRQIADQP